MDDDSDDDDEEEGHMEKGSDSDDDWFYNIFCTFDISLFLLIINLVWWRLHINIQYSSFADKKPLQFLSKTPLIPTNNSLNSPADSLLISTNQPIFKIPTI